MYVCNDTTAQKMSWESRPVSKLSIKLTTLFFGVACFGVSDVPATEQKKEKKASEFNFAKCIF